MALYRTSLVVIARNEAPRIVRLLKSVQRDVDDLVVLDTGSSDSTPELAASAGARVLSVAWPDDFAAARNMALDFACADWNLVLDADEWLIEGGDFLRELRQVRPDFVGRLQIQDQSVSNSTWPEHSSRSWLSRLLPGNIRYRGRIHEQPVHKLPLRQTPLVACHDGYSPGALSAKRGRNRRLLLKELQDHPEDPYLLYQLGKDADVYREDALAVSSFTAAWPHVLPSAPWRLDLVVRWIGALKRLDRHAEAADIIESTKGELDFSPDFHFASGDLMLDWTRTAPHLSVPLLGRAEQAWLRCLQIGERTDQPESVPGRGSHLAAFNLALILEGTNRGPEAAALRSRFGLPVGPLLA